MSCLPSGNPVCTKGPKRLVTQWPLGGDLPAFVPGLCPEQHHLLRLGPKDSGASELQTGSMGMELIGSAGETAQARQDPPLGSATFYLQT